MKHKEFHPPHLYLDKVIYFITAKTRDRFPYFETDENKSLWKKVLFEMVNNYNVALYAWVITDFHYHLLLKVNDNRKIFKFIKALHGKSAIVINKAENKPGRKIWVNYWDKCIRNEKDFWTHVNYIHHNPVKHGFASKMEDYEYSSYNDYLSKYGQEWLDDAFAKYPIIDFMKQGKDK